MSIGNCVETETIKAIACSQVAVTKGFNLFMKNELYEQKLILMADKCVKNIKKLLETMSGILYV